MYRYFTDDIFIPDDPSVWRATDVYAEVYNQHIMRWIESAHENVEALLRCVDMGIVREVPAESIRF